MPEDPPEPPDLIRIRASLGPRYEVHECVGVGATAYVYRALDTNHGREIALKILRPELVTTAAAVRFAEAARRTAQLQHPHIVPLYESQVSDGLVYFSMPFARDASLRDRLEREGSIPASEALEIIVQVADALHYAHQHGVIHRDIKPENILLGEGHAQLADFGIARAVEIATEETRLTSAGVILGTPAYMSPEQIQNDKALDGSSDLYSLGCVLYEMLSGRMLFSGSTPEVIAQHLRVPAPPLPLNAGPLPESVHALLAQSLDKSKGRRFRDAAEMRNAAAAARRDVERNARDRWWTRRRVAFVAGTALMLAVLGVLARGVRLSDRSAASTSPADSQPYDRMVVLPFQFHGPAESEYLAEGAAALLRFALDGAGPIRCSEGPTRRSAGDPAAADAELRARAGRAAGANAVLDGNVYVYGDRIRIETSLFPLAPEGGAPRTAEGEGSPSELSNIVTKLAASVATSRLRGHLFVPAPATLDTRVSLATLKEFLAAEDFYRRDELDRALLGMRHVLTLDSTFAVAWARLARFEAAAGEYSQARRSAEIARQQKGRLPRQEFLYLQATHGYVWGDADEAEAAARKLTAEYPDDAEAWRTLAQTLLGYNSLRGRLAEESYPAYLQVHLLQPDDESAVAALVSDAGRRHLPARVDSLYAQFLATAPDSAAIRPMALRVALARADAGAAEALLQDIRRTGNRQETVIAAAMFGHGDGWGRVAAILRSLDVPGTPVEDRVFQRIRCAALSGCQGRWDEAESDLRAVESLNPRIALLYRGLLAARIDSAVGGDTRERLRVQLELTDEDAAAFRSRPGGELFEEIEAPWPMARGYVLGLLAASEGRSDLAEQQARFLARPWRDAFLDAWARTYVAGIRARVEWEAGRPARALSQLEGIRQLSQPGLRVGFRTLTHERFLRAKALVAVGRSEEAMPWFKCLDDLFLFDRIYLGQTLLAESRIEREEGDLVAARSSALRAARLLARCDPEQEALRLAALAAAAADSSNGRPKDRISWGEQYYPM